MAHEQQVLDFWRRVWTEGDVEFAHEFFAPAYSENGLDRTPTTHAEGATAFRSYFPDFSVEVVRLLAAGDIVADRVRYRGTYAGDWPGIDAAGVQVDVGGVDVFRFENDLVVEHLHEADHEAIWEQLGVRLPPG